MAEIKNEGSVEPMVNTKLGSRDLLIKLLKENNVSFNEEEDGNISFKYGDKDDCEYIEADVSNECGVIRLYDLVWHEVSVWNFEEIADIQKKINVYNYCSFGRIVYSFTDDDKMRLSSTLTAPFSEELPNLMEYLRTLLANLFDTHDILNDEEEIESANVNTANANQKGGEE